MEVTSDILELLKGYSAKQRGAVIEFSEFAEYIRHYAQYHVNENGALATYLGSTDETLRAELARLASTRQIVLTDHAQGKQTIFVVSAFMERYAETYKDIDKNISVPFPNINDIPKNIPADVVSKVQASELLPELMDKGEQKKSTLYALQFNRNVAAVLFPSSVPVNQLVKLCLKKLQDMLRREEFHDYFLKKLVTANPGKEMVVKNFFTLFVARPEDALDSLKATGDNFYSWNQLCYFIQQDYIKHKDLTLEEVNVLQSISIIEIVISYFKTKAADKAQKTRAFEEFDSLLANPPYYFTKDDIEKMHDAHGKLLLGQYSKEELNEHIAAMRAEAVGNSLPELLVFKNDEGEGYFILKSKIMQLIIRLCNDARAVIRNSISHVWKKALLDFETLPEMKDQPAFERCLERELQAAEPVLFSLLHASFLPVVAFEDNTPGHIALYRNGVLVPYSELLLISRQEIYTNAKVTLPFWYSLPVVSWLMAFFKRKSKAKKGQGKSNETATEKMLKQEKAEEVEKMSRLNAADKTAPRSRKAVRNVALAAEQKLVPSNSTLDRELEGYLGEWNDRLNGPARGNLTTDVNGLIRDYLRKVLRSLKAEGFSPERISSLAKSLAESPSLMKIKNHPALARYIELYMIKLLKNLPSA